ncbi:four helix bundle protein [Vreelandella titanicae]|uniref:Four helix bundle protein n=1 Tax=Vreelandella titanicae TaxID=664683 RepID=A0A558J1P8_9GAMM|nr:four helix bundle protein [Halomonas titanicae]TVU87595.1 four helix bundle protein [Halomonas titanicae]
MRKHQELRVWQQAMDLVEHIYRVTAEFPDEEKYGLTSQLRRAAVSVPSNIAEGAARGSTKDFVRFLFIARGSLSEIETQLLIGQRLNYLQDVTSTIELIHKVSGLLGGLIRNLQSR